MHVVSVLYMQFIIAVIHSQVHWCPGEVFGVDNKGSRAKGGIGVTAFLKEWKRKLLQTFLTIQHKIKKIERTQIWGRGLMCFFYRGP